MKVTRVIAATALMIILSTLTALGGWPHEPDENIAVCTAEDAQGDVVVIGDGDGGIITVWEDHRLGGYSSSRIYAQRLSRLGEPLWSENGVLVSESPGGQHIDPCAVSDGAGGVIVAWLDDEYQSNEDDIYAQRIDGSGNLLWGAGGVAVSTAPSVQDYVCASPDGSGGAYIAWRDYRDSDFDIYVQRLDADGQPLFEVDGANACNATDTQSRPQIITTDGGAAVIVWEDYRSGSDYDICGQLVMPDGAMFWGATGNYVCYDTGNQMGPDLVGDGLGGALVTWVDYGGAADDICAQRMSAAGVALWGYAGIPVCDASNDQGSPQIVSDGEGGALLSWKDSRDDTFGDIYAQRIDPMGSAVWAANGIVVCDAAYGQSTPSMAGDGAGGALIAWQDSRGYVDIFCQRVDPNGTVLWDENGIVLCNAASSQSHPAIADDTVGGLVAVWEDTRSGGYDLYAQRIERNGMLGYPAPELTAVLDYPQDQGGVLIVDWDPAYLDIWPDLGIDYYTLWRGLVAGEPPRGRAETPVLAGMPQSEVEEVNSRGWVYVDQVDAMQMPSYSYHAPSYGDSTVNEVVWTEYMVMAHSTSLETFWYSDPLSGYSVDNLAPGAPLDLLAEAADSDVLLTWTPSGQDDEDLSVYRIYRSEQAGFTPGEANFLAEGSDTLYTDTNPGYGTWYYRVRAKDVHENEGDSSNEADATVTSVVDGVAPTALALRGNHPNPFNPATTITFDLPSPMRVRLQIHDTAGHLLAILVEETMEAGAHEVMWRGEDASGRALPSGVYFARLETAGETMTRKMVMLK